ncbi:MAG: hypothetical protein QOE45_3287 [Frankiaceae bacterium]|jgi:hypothetical protein|nr:hypothetical protein [Frankiaceae bacterium]
MHLRDRQRRRVDGQECRFARSAPGVGAEQNDGVELKQSGAGRESCATWSASDGLERLDLPRPAP